jgi:hypothetical protein
MQKAASLFSISHHVARLSGQASRQETEKQFLDSDLYSRVLKH